MHILSWNVNGLRSCARKGYLDWLGACGADIVALQEVRALPEQLDDEVRAPEKWHTYFSPAERKGYSGVGLYSRRAIDHMDTLLGKDEFDCEGRVQIATIGKLLIANVYFPNGSGKNRDNSRVPYKLAFYRCLRKKLEAAVKQGYRVLCLGDFNTAHKEIDLARPKANRGTSGFLPEECAELDSWVDGIWTDTFRHFCKEPEHYTWWSNRQGARERNVGWRIDYVLASDNALPFVKDAFIFPNDKGSDHCPLGVEVKKTILK